MAKLLWKTVEDATARSPALDAEKADGERCGCWRRRCWHLIAGNEVAGSSLQRSSRAKEPLSSDSLSFLFPRGSLGCWRRHSASLILPTRQRGGEVPCPMRTPLRHLPRYFFSPTSLLSSLFAPSWAPLRRRCPRGGQNCEGAASQRRHWARSLSPPPTLRHVPPSLRVWAAGH